MKKIILQLIILLLYGVRGFAQTAVSTGEPTTNNLVHTPGYETSAWGAVPNYMKFGNGPQALILIPGFGFDFTVFDDFMQANKNVYTMYAITIPGYSRTAAPPMPSDTSYSQQNWTRSVEEGLLQLMRMENLRKPILVGHFTQGAQLALQLAADYSNRVGGLIIMGAPAKFIAVLKSTFVKSTPLSFIKP